MKKCHQFRLLVAALLIGLFLYPAQTVKALPASFQWGSVGSLGGVRDTDNVTYLVNGDLAQFIWTGPDGMINPPNCDGSPGGDDLLLDTNTVVDVGAFPPPLRNRGNIPSRLYSYDTDYPQDGGGVYIRAWNSSSVETATAYGDSATATLSSGGTYNAMPWNTGQIWGAKTWVGPIDGDWHQGTNWSDGAVPGNSSNVLLPGTARVQMSADGQAGCLTIQPGALLDLGASELNIQVLVINNGSMRQTKTVANNSIVSFLQINTDRYRGVEINTMSSGINLGAVTVTIAGNQAECTNAASSLDVNRCFQIDPEFQGPARISLYVLDDELNGILTGNLSIYRSLGGAGWQELTSLQTGTVSGGYSFAQADTPGFSAFLLGDHTQGPTIVELKNLASGMNMMPSWLLILSGSALLIAIFGMAIALKARVFK